MSIITSMPACRPSYLPTSQLCRADPVALPMALQPSCSAMYDTYTVPACFTSLWSQLSIPCSPCTRLSVSS